MTEEIRDIITYQIDRHVAMSKEHREWLAKDIADRVCAVVEPVITRLSDPHFDREGARLDDTARLNWLDDECSHTRPVAAVVVKVGHDRNSSEWANCTGTARESIDRAIEATSL